MTHDGKPDEFLKFVYKPVKTEFRWTGDGYGNAATRVLKQIKRVGDIAIYKRTVEKTGSDDGYEVVKIHRHNGYTLGGQFIEPAETYPGCSQFGKSAWSCVNLAHAESVFNQKVTEATTRSILEASGQAPKKRGRPRKIKA